MSDVIVGIIGNGDSSSQAPRHSLLAIYFLYNFLCYFPLNCVVIQNLTENYNSQYYECWSLGKYKGSRTCVALPFHAFKRDEWIHMSKAHTVAEYNTSSRCRRHRRNRSQEIWQKYSFKAACFHGYVVLASVTELKEHTQPNAFI